MLNSYYKDLGEVELPRGADRQLRMHTFHTDMISMPVGFEDYELIARILCEAACYSGEAHLTVDERTVEAGWSQRRPRAHVDGCYDEKIGVWIHPADRMPIIVAASVAGCVAYRGQFDGTPKDDGDLEHIREQFGESELLPGGRAFLLSPDCVHESLRFAAAVKRTFIRIALGRAK